MKLLVLAHANRTAGPRYVAGNLIRALAGLGRGIRIIPVLPVGCGYEEMAESCALNPIWFDQKKSRLRRFLFDMVVLPRRVHQHKPDAILSLGSNGLLRPQVPQAILVQDPHFVYPREHYGNMTPMEHVRYFIQRRQLRSAIACSRLVYCQTPVMLARVADTFNVDGRLKILPKCVTPLPPDVSGSAGAAAEALRTRAGRFRLICLCRYYAHKNLEILCDAFEQCGELLDGIVVFLTIAPGQHPHAGPLLERIGRAGLSDQIVNVGPIPQRDIPICLASCEGLLMPTKMESFSGAYLDAMQAGLPILTSDRDFAHEVCCDAAIYFDPSSPKAMAEVMVRLKSDRSLQQRLVEAGKERLRRVYSQSWEEVAAQVVADLTTCVSKEGTIVSHFTDRS